MNESVLLLCDKPASDENVRGGDFRFIKAELPVAETQVPLTIKLLPKPISLPDIVPLARAISDKLCSVLLSSLAAGGHSVPCSKGCCVCCRYLVSLSMPEVYRLRQELARMESWYRMPILSSCLSAARKILGSASVMKAKDAKGLSQWYWQLDIECPFLHHGVCSIYAIRPLACREHFVTTPPMLCRPASLSEPSVVSIPVSILEALGQLAAELEHREIESVMLPFVFADVDEDNVRCRRTWPADYMVERFVQILQTLASGQSADVLRPR